MKDFPKHLIALERKLQSKGFPALSPFWRETLLRFFETGKRQLVLRVGRRGGKSSSLCRVGVILALFGDFKIPPGDVGCVAFISVDRGEANKRLRTIRALLDALGVAYKPVEHGVELVGKPIIFQTFVATVSGVSGFTSIAVICDEVSKWKDRDSGANPAKEVLASVRPTMATQPGAKLFLSSSAFSTDDAHCRAYEEGETVYQCVAGAPTWVAHPALTEEQTKLEEPEHRVWLREYANIPQASVSAAFDPNDVKACFRKLPGDSEGWYSTPIVVIDSSSGRGDAWTACIARYFVPKVPVEWYELSEPLFQTLTSTNTLLEIPHSRRPLQDDLGFPILKAEFCDRADAQFVLHDLIAFEGRFGEHMKGDRIAASIAELAEQFGATRVFADQREEFANEVLFRQVGLGYHPYTWDNENKQAAVAHIRRGLAQRSILIEPNETMEAQLLRFTEKLTPTGYVTYGARSGQHDDHAALLLTATMALLDGQIPGTPHRYRQVSAPRNATSADDPSTAPWAFDAQGRLID